MMSALGPQLCLTAMSQGSDSHSRPAEAIERAQAIRRAALTTVADQLGAFGLLPLHLREIERASRAAEMDARPPARKLEGALHAMRRFHR